MNFELRKFIAPEILMGSDVRFLAGNYFRSLEINKILIITDNNITQQFWFQPIIDRLEQENISYTIFKDISPNSPHTEVMKGLEVFRSNLCQGILAIGGGSVMDSAKGIGIVISNEGNVLDYEGVDRIDMPTPPIACIPTTSGTSSDVSQFAIIRNMDEKYKIAIISKSLVPDLSLLDPLVCTTMDPFLTACTGLDALTHAVEAYVSTGCSSITDFHALNAIKLIKENLYQAYSYPDNIEYRYNMMIASLEAGLAFSNASLGAVHALSHSLGGIYNLAHGECNAILLNYVAKANFSESPEKYKTISETLGLKLTSKNTKENMLDVFKIIEEHKKSVQITNSLGDLNVKKGDYKNIIKYALADPCMFTNPRSLTNTDLELIIEEAM